MNQLGRSLLSFGLLVSTLVGCGSEDTSRGLLGTRLVINEACATNQGIWAIRDDFGETDDWIELYNGEDFEQRLDGYFLSDDPNDTMKSELAGGLVMGPKGYLVLWADKQPEQGSVHLDFKLKNTDGQGVFLTDPSGRLIDRITLRQVPAEGSFARIPDGSGALEPCGPTPGRSNSCWNVDLGGTGGSRPDDDG
jgi:hypothetical protein